MSNFYPFTKPTHDYVIYAACGCPVTVIADMPGMEKNTAKKIAKELQPGEHIERVAITDIGPILENLGCSCGEMKQLVLL